MKLIYLPNELLQIITTYLPRTSLSRLCYTCTLGYQLFLPTLYRHVELSRRTQIKQLEQGLARNSYLRQVVKEHTQILTLKCRQGNNWSCCSKNLFSRFPNLKHLYFCDFLSLSVTKLIQVLVTLPRLKSLDFQYCDLITTPIEDEEEQDCYNNDKGKEVLFNLTQLNLMWTDFTTEAIRQLLIMTPNLNHVVLGANHNRKPLANDSALHVMTQLCPFIKHLEISLQQVKEASLCQLIGVYGSQLENLSIRCEGNETIRQISRLCTKKLQHLVIRCSTNSSNAVVGYNQEMMHVLEQCHALTHLEMVSWPLQDVPSVVLDQLRYKASSSAIQAPNSSYIEGIKRTVALDRQDLQEIRRLCLY